MKKLTTSKTPRRRQNVRLKRAKLTRTIAESRDVGVSFSIPTCHEYVVDWKKALQSTMQIGFKRLRLMSYWSLHEQREGEYNFTLLDEQLAIIEKLGGRVSLSIGMRQPRWPETHVPKWAEKLTHDEATEAYMQFHKAVIVRYRDNQVIESWQLENEFWLRSFGENFDFSRKRLRREFDIIRHLNPERPIIMSTAKVISLPLGSPTPDLYATSMYRVTYHHKSASYTHTPLRPWMYRVRTWLTKLLKNRETIIHELQTEPWGPHANWEMTSEEQLKSMNDQEILVAVDYAKNTGIHYIDMWGAEWWYWRSQKYGDKNIKKIVSDIVHDNLA